MCLIHYLVSIHITEKSLVSQNQRAYVENPFALVTKDQIEIPVHTLKREYSMVQFNSIEFIILIVKINDHSR